MLFEEYKQKVIDVTPISDGLKFKIAIAWLHREHLPVGVVGINDTDTVIRVPRRHHNSYGYDVSVIAIANGVLGTAQNLTDLILPPSIDRFTPYTFKNCRKLKRLTIPKNIRSIPEKAFEDCVSLEDIYYEGTAEDWSKINIVWDKYVSIIDDSKLGLHCKVTNVRYPVFGNEPLFRARIHFGCDLSEGDCGKS
ncbi:MAG: leucine-rich repeat domain-containing protein [Clostridia bacterium]|nr:leucine-rich repeat domain-containing protein [Clostridia bacterium]